MGWEEKLPGEDLPISSSQTKKKNPTNKLLSQTGFFLKKKESVTFRVSEPGLCGLPPVSAAVSVARQAPLPRPHHRAPVGLGLALGQSRLGAGDRLQRDDLEEGANSNLKKVLEIIKCMYGK